MDVICPSAIEALVRIWAVLHRDLVLKIDLAETRYLQAVMLWSDDELVAGLLGAKLAMTSRRNGRRAKQAAAHIGSDVLFSVQGLPRRATLVHGHADEDGRLGAGTRFGAALLGMSQGTTILWPIEHGSLVEVRLLELGARADWEMARSPDQVIRRAKACACGRAGPP